MIDNERPLSIGEILDRAITAFVRNIVPLFAILGLIAVPIAMVAAFASPQTANLFNTINDLSRVAPGDSAGLQRIMSQLQLGSRPTGWTALVVILTLLGYPYARTAFIMYVARVADGVRPSIPQALRAALGRLVPQLVVELAVVVLIFALAIVIFIISFLGIFAIVGVALIGKIVGIVLGVIIGTIVIVAALAAFIYMFMAWEFALVGVATEDPNPIRAIGRALRRTFDRTLIWRTLLVGLALFIIQTIGGLVFFALGALAISILHAPVIEGLIVAIGRILIDGLQLLFIFFYVRDVRVRREGLDLARAIAVEAAPA